jgi:hypothetical protein
MTCCNRISNISDARRKPQRLYRFALTLSKSEADAADLQRVVLIHQLLKIGLVHIQAESVLAITTVRVATSQRYSIYFAEDRRLSNCA